MRAVPDPGLDGESRLHPTKGANRTRPPGPCETSPPPPPASPPPLPQLPPCSPPPPPPPPQPPSAPTTARVRPRARRGDPQQVHHEVVEHLCFLLQLRPAR